MSDAVPKQKVAAARVQAPRADAARVDPVHAEHILIASDEAPDPQSAGHTVRQRWRLWNPLRRELTEVTLFDEGYLEVVEHARDRGGEPFRLDLHYLDPIPSINRVIAKRAWQATAGCAAVALGALAFSSLGPLVVSFALATGAAALGAAAIAVHRSHEKTEFYTLHGRARVLAIVANLGARKSLRAFVLELSGAIEEAAEKITGDTSSFLRAEMREHYRLRGDGVLTPESCAESTGRILAQFDVQF